MNAPRSGKVNAYAYAHLIKRLREGDASREELSRYTGLNPMTVGHYVNELRRAKQVYISAWAEPEDGGRNKVAHYTLGTKADVKRVPLTQAEIRARYVARQKARKTQSSHLEGIWNNPQP